MRSIFKKHRFLWAQKSFVLSILVGVCFLAIGLTTTYYANFYTISHASNAVTDILLDNLPVVNVNFLYSEGAVIFLIIVGIILLYEPRRIPFVLKSAALFILIRAVFTTLTHLAPPLHESYVDTEDLIFKLGSGSDLFFSGHAGLPFLFALIFWNEKLLKYFFLLAAATGGVVVILGHLHYSIDVFSALFIAFGIFHISKKLFSKDYRMILSA